MAESKLQLEDWLDDLCVRFIINLPEEDLSTVARICFQVEEAQWYYEDFIRPMDPTLPSMTLRNFCLRIFQHCPLLETFSVENHTRAFEEFLLYKTRVPVRGAILLNEAMDSTVLVKGWKKGANWSFPRGKINKDEDDLDCAIREVEEETGLNLKDAGLVPKNEDVKYIEISMREQQIRLYVFRNVPMDTPFSPKTRKEISKIEWYKLSELPAFRKKGNQQQDDAAAASNANKFYMVAPFLVPLKKWVVDQKKKDARLLNKAHLSIHPLPEEPLTEDDIGNQTEEVPDSTTMGVSVMATQEADRELQRLLKSHGSTQGVQVRQDPSQALLAILQGPGNRGVELQSQPVMASVPAPGVYQVPHTLAEQVYSQPPQPLTPQHYHPGQRIHLPNNVPPPSFPFAPHWAGSHASSGAYQGQFRGPGMNGHQIPMNMMPNAFAMQGNHQQQQQQQDPRVQPILAHPQPLPPHVEPSRLARDILTTPNLQDMMNKSSMPPSMSVPPAAHNMPSGVLISSRQPQQRENKPQYTGTGPQIGGAPISMAPPPASLSNQKMALLNSFKSQTSLADRKLNGNALSGSSAGGPVDGQSTVNVSVLATSTSAQTTTTTMQILSSNMRLPPSSGNNPLASTLQATTQPSPRPIAANSAALLDLFKKSAPLSPTSSEVPIKPATSERTGLLLGSQGMENLIPKASNISTHAPIAQIPPNGVARQGNPDISLPYRAVSILTRPKAESRTGDFMNSQAHGNAPIMSASQIPALTPRDEVERGKNPSRQTENPGDAAAFAAKQAQLLNLLKRPSPAAPAVPAAPAAPVVAPQRQEPTIDQDQQQKLLSLFSKPQLMSATRSLAEGTMSRSQGAPLNSPMSQSSLENGSLAPRRGSQTPKSPGENFLMDYLRSVGAPKS